MSKSKASTHRDAPTIATLLQNPASYVAATYIRESRCAARPSRSR